MLIKISDTFYVDLDSLSMVSYHNEELKILFKGQTDWIMLIESLHKPFLAEVETWSALRAKVLLNTVTNLEKSL